MRVVNWLRAFNQIRDDLMIEIASTLLLLGFVVGTVDVLTRGSLTTNAIFQDAWSVVQALTVDVLFFAVWGRVGRASWNNLNWRQIVQNAILIIVGILLLGVAVLVNGLVNEQQLLSLPSMAATMSALGVDQTAFTMARSVLVGVLAVLIAVVGRLGHVQSQQGRESDTSALAKASAQVHDERQATTDTAVTPVNVPTGDETDLERHRDKTGVRRVAETFKLPETPPSLSESHPYWTGGSLTPDTLMRNGHVSTIHATGGRLTADSLTPDGVIDDIRMPRVVWLDKRHANQPQVDESLTPVEWLRGILKDGQDHRVSDIISEMQQLFHLSARTAQRVASRVGVVRFIDGRQHYWRLAPGQEGATHASQEDHREGLYAGDLLVSACEDDLVAALPDTTAGAETHDGEPETLAAVTPGVAEGA